MWNREVLRVCLGSSEKNVSEKNLQHTYVTLLGDARGSTVLAMSLSPYRILKYLKSADQTPKIGSTPSNRKQLCGSDVTPDTQMDTKNAGTPTYPFGSTNDPFKSKSTMSSMSAVPQVQSNEAQLWEYEQERMRNLRIPTDLAENPIRRTKPRSGDRNRISMCEALWIDNVFD